MLLYEHATLLLDHVSGQYAIQTHPFIGIGLQWLILTVRWPAAHYGFESVRIVAESAEYRSGTDWLRMAGVAGASTSYLHLLAILRVTLLQIKWIASVATISRPDSECSWEQRARRPQHPLRYQ